MTEKTIILEATVGSIAYGLAGPNSDIDTLGIYVEPLDKILGLDGIGKGTWDGHEPADFCYHEVSKFIGLALKANPTVLELLYIPEYRTINFWGQKLVDNRKIFLSEKYVRSAYGGYAKQQADRLMRRTEEGKEGFGGNIAASHIAKHARHCLRLLMQGSQLLADGTMTVNVSEHRDFLFKIGDKAVSDPQGFYDYFEQALEKFNSIFSKLPEESNRYAANLLLIDIRKGIG